MRLALLESTLPLLEWRQRSPSATETKYPAMPLWVSKKLLQLTVTLSFVACQPCGELGTDTEPRIGGEVSIVMLLDEVKFTFPAASSISLLT